MEIRILKYFLTVVREESITRAADVLHITQPTLSRQLAQMEDEVGVKLFERGTRKISLTSEGILLRRRAEEIIELVDKTEKELLEQEELIDGEISIGCGELHAVQVLPDLFDSFSKRFPLVRYNIYTGNADQIKERIDRGLLDIGLLLEPIDIEKYDFVRLPIRERWVVLMRPDDPLAEKEGVTAKDLAALPVIMVRRPAVQNELASWFGRYFKKLHIAFTSNLSTNASVMVHRGLGYALVIEGSLPFVDKTKVCFRPLEPELAATSVLAWKKQQPFSPAVSKFIDHIQCFLSMSKS